MNPRFDDLDSIADMVAATRPETVPEDVLEDARYALADTLAVAVHPPATSAPVGDVPGSGGGPVRIWWTGRRERIADASFANAYRVHSSDFDSVHYLTFGHPAAVSLPPLIALYESGFAGPLAVLTGYALSVEVMAVLGVRFGEALRAATYHPTVVLGAPACAASCTWSLGGDAAAIRWAMAYAASTTIGFDTHFGSDIKPLQVAECARAGLHAAQLALRRDGRDPRRPWYVPIAKLAGIAPDAAATPHAFGRPWATQIVATRCKELPICGYFDPVLAAWRAGPTRLREPAAIRRVRVEAPEYLMRANRFTRPANLDEARFSLPLLIALLLRYRDVTPASYAPSQLADAGLRHAMEAVDVVPAQPGEPGVIRVLGHDREWSLPLRSSAADARISWPWLEAKLAGCGLPERAHEVVTHIRDFETSTPARWQDLISAPARAAA